MISTMGLGFVSLGNIVIIIIIIYLLSTMENTVE